MKKLFFPLLCLIILHSCNTDDESFTPENLSTYSAEHFILFEQNLTSEDFCLTEDGSLIIAANGRMNEASSERSPFVGQLDENDQFLWFHFMDLDDRSGYKDIKVIPMRNNDFMLASGLWNNSDWDFELLKFDALSNIAWQKRIGEASIDDFSFSLAMMDNDNVLLFWLTSVPGEQWPSDNQLKLMRINENGEAVWEEILDTSFVLRTVDVIVYEEEERMILLSEHKESNLGPTHIMLRQLDLEGHFLWEKRFDSNINYNSLVSSVITPTFDDGLCLTYAYNDDSILIIKLDSEGNEDWRSMYTLDSGGEFMKDIIQTQDGGFVLLTHTSSYGNGGLDILLAKISKLGEVEWQKTFGSSDSDQGTAILEKPNGSLITLGNTNHQNDNEATFDMLLLKTDAEGNPL
jgi:hypothetical protein